MGKLKNLLALFGAVALVFVLVTAVWPRVQPLLAGMRQFDVDTVGEQDAANFKVDMCTAVLDESTKQQSLVVLDYEAHADTTISNTPLLDFAVFKKSQTVRTYGTGTYAVDLGGLTTSNITVDEAAQTVTLRVPHACLRYINLDQSKSEIVDSTNGLLAFGEMSLTQEERTELAGLEREALRGVLTSTESFELADAAAREKVYETFAPVVAALSEDYLLIVEFDPGTANLDLSENPA